MYEPPLSLILLVAGALLVDEAGYQMSQTWITLAFIGWFASFVIGVTFYGAQGKKLEAAVAAGSSGSPVVAAVYDRVALVNMLELGVLLLVVIDMAVKPGL